LIQHTINPDGSFDIQLAAVHLRLNSLINETTSFLKKAPDSLTDNYIKLISALQATLSTYETCKLLRLQPVIEKLNFVRPN
jgi:hypothetical protein